MRGAEAGFHGAVHGSLKTGLGGGFAREEQRAFYRPRECLPCVHGADRHVTVSAARERVFAPIVELR